MSPPRFPLRLWRFGIALALSAGGVAALAGAAQALGSGEVTVAATPPAPGESATAHRAPGADPLDLSHLSRRHFLEDRRRYMARLSAAEKAGERAWRDAILDLAEFYLAHGWTIEARGFAEALDPEATPAPELARAARIAAALDAVEGHPGAAERLDRPPLSHWAEQPLFRALALVQEGELAAAAPLLPAALDRLPAWPGPFAEIALPLLMELAVETDQWDHARDLAMRFDAHPGLRRGNAYWFFLARASELAGDPLAAFDGYLRAAEGAGQVAQRARLAIVDLGLATGSLEPAEAMALLESLRWSWRGDALSGRGLLLLADLAVQSGDEVTALAALGQLLNDGAAEPQEQTARQQAKTLLEIYYARGRDGEIGLAEFMEGHRRVTRAFRFDPYYHVHALGFAERFSSAGITAVAAREFAALHDLHVLAGQLDLWPVPEGTREDLRLREAEALLAGGDPAAALERVDAIDPVPPSLLDRARLLRVRALAELGETAALVASAGQSGGGEPARLKAEALFADGDWAAAADAYQQLKAGPEGLSRNEAIRLLLATHRAGDREGVLLTLTEFPDLVQSTEWAEIADGLVRPGTGGAVLSQELVRSGVAAADQTLQLLDSVEPKKSQ